MTGTPYFAYTCPKVVIGRHRALASLKHDPTTLDFLLQGLVRVCSKPHRKLLYHFPWQWKAFVPSGQIPDALCPLPLTAS